MQTQRDHVHAYAFQAGRLSAALLSGEAAYLEAPARRAKLGLVLGLIVALLIGAGFFLYGLIRHQVAKQHATAAVSAPFAVPHHLSPTGRL